MTLSCNIMLKSLENNYVFFIKKISLMTKEWKCKDAACTRTFTTYNSMFSHWQAKHLNPRFKCLRCDKVFPRHSQRALHYYREHVSTETGISEPVIAELPAAPVVHGFRVPVQHFVEPVSMLGSYTAF